MRFVIILYGFRGYFKQNKKSRKIFYEIENTNTFHKNLKPFPLWVEQDCFFAIYFYAFSADNQC